MRDRLRGVVLLGRDRAVIAEALARHAPDVPVIEVADGDTGVMDRVVAGAAELAQPGDTVLLAPGCASMDMFANYGARGDAFAEAVHRIAAGEPTRPTHGSARAGGHRVTTTAGDQRRPRARRLRRQPGRDASGTPWTAR